MGNKGENIGDGGGWSRRFGRTMPHIRSAASGQNPQRPGVRNLGDLARIEGADQRFPYLILQFLGLHSGLLKVPVLTLSVCLFVFVFLVALLPSFVESSREH